MFLIQITIAISQPIVNERYIIGDETHALFGSVISTDSCYYTIGVHGDAPLLNDRESTFIKYNFDGTIIDTSIINNDTMGIDFWQGYNLIKTLDNNFAAIAVVRGETSKSAFLFAKISPFGDTLFTHYIYDFYELDNIVALSPSELIQNKDSSYYAIVGSYRADDSRSPTVFFKLDKYGNLLFYKVFYGIATSYHHILKPNSLIRYDDNKLIIGSSLRHVYGGNENIRFRTKLLVVDTLGNLLEEHLYSEDTLSLDCNGLTKTVDGGLLYCGRIGRYFPDENHIRYGGRIVKLRADFSIEWEIESEINLSYSTIGLNKIKAISDSEFVAVGHGATKKNFTGWLIKFNIDGEKIWERKYYKVQHFSWETNYPTHKLYDVDITTDGGFVMVGESTNYYTTNIYQHGQLGWLIKTDKHGCIVPDCQLLDNPIDTTDTTSKPPPKPKPDPEPITWLYPNPTSSSLFYYHHQDEFSEATAYIINTAGQIVQRWQISENDITFEVDVSSFAVGTYFIRVENILGEEIAVERFVKI